MSQTPPPIWPPQYGPGPPRCLDCGYVLIGLDVGHCPECGRAFNLSQPFSYTLKPPLVRWRLWLPGLLLAAAGGLIGLFGLVWMGNWGWSLWFAVPFATGGLLGYRMRARWGMAVLLGLMLIVVLVLGLMSTSLAGVYCGLTLALLAFGPILLGTALGAALRVGLKATNFSQRWHLPALLIALLPFACALIEGKHYRSPGESVSTEIVIPASVPQCWDAIMFYEQVRHEPPLILRIGLARPRFTSGRCEAPGDVKVCVYNKGQIIKRVDKIEPGKALTFDVTEQRIGYEHDVRLIGGSSIFHAVDADRTLVQLTTEYEPLLHPRWCWRPFERFAIQTLHGHVLEGMRRRACGEEPITVAKAGYAH